MNKHLSSSLIRSIRTTVALVIGSLFFLLKLVDGETPPPTPIPTPTGYNVLWLMTDEHTVHALNCYGNAVMKTPNLDSIATSGAILKAAYCQDPICVPSRSSFVCGKMPSEIGVFGNEPAQAKYGTTIAQVFKKAGYTAAWLGKTHYAGDPGFDKIDGEEGKISKARKEFHDGSRLPQEASVVNRSPDDEMEAIDAQFAIKFLQTHKDKKFFLGVSFPKPHFPYVAIQKYYDMYKHKVDMPLVLPQMLKDLPIVSVWEREKYGLNKMTDAQTEVARTVYYGMITFVDELFGQILGELDRLNLRDNTIILYTADHGEMMGEHGLWYKNSFFEGSARVPNLWSFPKLIKPGTVIDTPTMNIDLFPTLCDMCGLPIPDGVEGKSLMPLFNGTEDGKDRMAFSENYRDGYSGKMVRFQNWKYCYYHKDRELLYDLSKDPNEADNVVSKPENKEIVAMLKEKALKGWIMEAPDNGKTSKAKRDAGE
jgi:arylsulfatase A-like enzyme